MKQRARALGSLGKLNLTYRSSQFNEDDEMKSTKPNCWGKAQFEICNGSVGPEIITVSGRDRWALECLVAVGSKGCTPIDTPGPRWSGYVFNLRELSVIITTITEPHSGPFSGTHARYVLHSKVIRVSVEVAA